MKIKQTRQVRLDALIKWIMNQEFKKGQQIQFTAKNDKPKDSMILFYERDGEIFGNFFTNSYNLNDLYTITEEVEITEETPLKRLVCVHSQTNNISCYNDVSIKKVNHLASYDKLTFIKIYLQNDDGSIGDLIWSKERGLNATNIKV